MMLSIWLKYGSGMIQFEYGNHVSLLLAMPIFLVTPFIKFFQNVERPDLITVDGEDQIQ